MDKINTIEEWKDLNLEGNYGKYKISTLGRVYNTHTNIFVSHVITGIPQYFYVNLRLSGKVILRRVHNLMARTFIPNPEGFKYVDHRDQNRFNNSLDNLRWIDRRGNANNMKSNVYINDLKVEDYIRTLTEDEDVIKSSVNKIYTFKLYTEGGAKEVVNYFTRLDEVKEEGKKETILKQLISRKFIKSIEFNNMWFPSTKSLCDYYNLRLSSFKRYTSQGLSDEMIIAMSKKKWRSNKVYNYKGVIGDIYHLIEVFNPKITADVFTDRKSNLSWSFEEALETVPRIRFYYYKGKKYSMKDLTSLLGLNIKQVRKKVSGYKYSLKDYCRDKGMPEWIDIELPS